MKPKEKVRTALIMGVKPRDQIFKKRSLLLGILKDSVV